MDYPIYEKQREIGRLYRETEGLYTVFRAKLPPGRELSRLWLAGEEGLYCLGLLEPRPCGRIFSRRFSRSEMKKLPGSICHAICAGAGEQVCHTIKKKEEQTAVPPSLPSAQCSGLRWQPSAMGCYTTHDGLSQLLAIPACLRCRYPQLRLVQIRGRSYLVFRC